MRLTLAEEEDQAPLADELYGVVLDARLPGDATAALRRRFRSSCPTCVLPWRRRWRETTWRRPYAA